MPEETQTQTNTTTESTEQTEQTQQTQQTQTEQTATEQTTTEQTTQKPGAPEAYEFKAPEGREYDADFLTTFTEVAKELDLPQDKAQSVLDKLSEKAQERQSAKLEEAKAQWLADSKKDTEFGGDKLEENLGIAKKALDAFGSDLLKAMLNDSGLGNHPELIRFFFKVGKAISEDTFMGGHREGKGQPKTFNDIAALLYGNTSQ